MKRAIRFLIDNPFLSGSLIMVLGSNSTSFLNYLYHIIMIRLLGPDGYGELVSIISIVGLLGVVPGSVGLVIVKYISSAKDQQEINDLISWIKPQIFKLSFLIFAVLILISPFITNFLHIKSLLFLIIMSFSFILALPTVLNRSALQGLLKFKEMVFSILVENAARLLLGVFFIFLGFHVGGALLGWVIANFIGWYLTTFYIKIKEAGHMTKANINVLRSMVLFIVPVIVYSLSTTFLYSTDIIFVKHFFSPHDAGLYAAVSTLGKIIFFGTSPIVSVMFPLVAHHHSKGGRYIKVFLYSFMVTFFLSMSLLVIYGLFPNFIISLLGGSSYLEASNLLVWFALFITQFTLSSLLINFNLSIGKTKVVIFPALAAAIQAGGIYLFHQNLFTVILVSIIVTALLLISLLIYSFYKILSQWK